MTLETLTLGKEVGSLGAIWPVALEPGGATGQSAPALGLLSLLSAGDGNVAVAPKGVVGTNRWTGSINRVFVWTDRTRSRCVMTGSCVAW